MKNKIKVIQIGGNLRINGISSFIMSLYRKMSERYEFIFINTASSEGYFKKEIEDLGGKVYNIYVNKRGITRKKMQSKMLRRIIRQEKPDVVHSHYYSNNGLYLKQAFLEGVPIRISHCHQSNEKGLTLFKKLEKNISRRMLRKYATKELACSQNARKFLYGTRGEVFLNPIDYRRFKINNDKELIYKTNGLSKENKYCLFIGRLSYQKNVLFLIPIMKEIKIIDKSIKLLIVGHGKDEESIKRKIYEMDLLETIKLLPPDSNINDLLNISSCFVLPSIYEGLPITLIEAQATGVECIVSDAVTDEVQQGLITYVPLETDLWVDTIIKTINKNSKRQQIYNYNFDIDYASFILDNYYRDVKAEEWILQGKELSIGSNRFYRNKYYSYGCFNKAHLLGNVKGTFYYALCFFEGNGVRQDKKFAEELVKNIVDYVQKKTANGHPDYECIIADMYSFGMGKNQDYSKAFIHYLAAAEKGFLEAQCNLGYMYLVGQGVNQDKKESAYWWKKSADCGFLHSMRDIGQSYLNGDGVEQDFMKACKYFKMASDRNYSHGTCDLAYCYLQGIGVEKNIDKATELYLLGVKQDEERTTRDLIENNIDVIQLKTKGKIVFLKNFIINNINENNSYNGTLIVNKYVQSIDPICFYNAHDIHKIFVVKDNPNYSMKNGVLFNKDKTVLIRYPIGNIENIYEVPISVIEIGDHAFQNSRNLYNIILNNGLVKIGDSAFDDCKALTTINLTDSIKQIGDWGFHGCDMIERIYVPKSITDIGVYAFGSCEKLEEIDVDKQNSKYTSHQGNLYNKEMTIFLQYSIGKKEKLFIMPKTVREISFRAFSDAYYLEEIDCSNVKIVSEKAFYYAISLRKVLVNEKPVLNGVKIFDNTHKELTMEVRR